MTKIVSGGALNSAHSLRSDVILRTLWRNEHLVVFTDSLNVTVALRLYCNAINAEYFPVLLHKITNIRQAKLSHK